MTDLPLHEEMVAILRHMGEPGLFPAGLYEKNLAQPNILFHLMAWALAYVVPTAVACKLVIATTIALIPPGAARVASHFERSPWIGLAVCPLAMGWLFLWGLIPNLLGLAALLWTLPRLDRHAASPRIGAGIACGAALVMSGVAHESAMVIGSGALFVFALSRGGSPRAWAPRLAPALVPLALAGMHHARVHDAMGDRSLPLFFRPLWARVADVPRILVGDGHEEQVVLLMLLGLAVATIVFVQRARKDDASAPPREPLVVAHRLEIVALACMLAYLAAPTNLGDVTMLHQRFLIPAAALAVCTVPSRRRDLGFVPRIALVAVAVGTLGARLPAFAQASRGRADVEKLLAYIEPASAVAHVHLGPPDPERYFSVTPAASRAVTVKGGRSMYSFANLPHSPVVFASRYRWWEVFRRVGRDPLSLRPADDLQYFRYLIVHADDPRLGAGLAPVLGPEARFVDASGEWLLFESRLPTVPLMSEERPTSTPTIRDRLAARGVR